MGLLPTSCLLLQTMGTPGVLSRLFWGEERERFSPPEGSAGSPSSDLQSPRVLGTETLLLVQTGGGED